VRKLTPDGIISTVAGGGKTNPPAMDGIPAGEALLGDTHSLAFDGVGDLFISGFYSNRLWKVSPEGLITTLYRQPGGAGPAGVAVDAEGDLFFADFGDGVVRKMTQEGVITTIAGTGKLGYSGDGGPATAARLNLPIGLAVDTAGNTFIADDGNHRVRRVSPDGMITSVAGNGTAGSSGDGGLATQAQLNAPFGLAVDSMNNLFIADTFDYRVRKVTPQGIISTVAGTGQGQLSGVGGPAASAGLRGPVGLAVDAAGNLFITDTAWPDQHLGRGHEPANEHVLEVVGVAAPGLIAGKPFPKP
jgi:DNA-binding beta-propeller fold protein YncE